MNSHGDRIVEQRGTGGDLSAEQVDRLVGYLRGVVVEALGHPLERRALVVWDRGSELSRGLAEAYRRVLVGARMVEFDASRQAEVLAALGELETGDLVVLVQSMSFRLDAFRIRLELFRRGLKVIEHPHLERMVGPEAEVYLESLQYDCQYFRGVGRALKERIDRAGECVVVSGGEHLRYGAGLEPAKLNVGDYAELPNVGGQFPIGEVFTESRDLEAVSGRVRIGFYGDRQFRVRRVARPITLLVEAGRVAGVLDSEEEFDHVLAQIRADEGQVWLRELGFGLNRAFSPTRTVVDIGTFERMCGVHLSLGAKHNSYNKPQIKKPAAKHHVDVFVDTDTVLLDGEQVFESGAWSVG